MALTDNLVSYWEFGLAESASVEDRVGDNDLTITDADGVFDNEAVTPMPGGVKGTAAGSAGNTIAKTTPTGLDGGAGGFTVNVWMRIPDVDIGVDPGYMFHRHGGPFRIRFFTSMAVMRADVSDGTDGAEATNGAAISAGVHMFTLVFVPGDSVTLYRNGALYANVSAAAVEAHAGSTAALGVISRTGSDVAKASVAESAFWSRPLSSGEVSQLYGGGQDPLVYRSGAFIPVSLLTRRPTVPFWLN